MFSSDQNVTIFCQSQVKRKKQKDNIESLNIDVNILFIKIYVVYIPIFN